MSTNLRFQRINSTISDNFDFTKGTIYFNDADNLIYVGTGDGKGTEYCKVYSGVRNVTWDSTNASLTFVNHDGQNVTIDFDNLVGFDDFDALVTGIGLNKISDKYVFSATGIADTSYLANSDSSTVIGALKSLDTAVSIARQNAGVISFGGKTGVISVKSDNTSTGYINFSMDVSTLNASIVDPSSAAYKTVEYFVGIENSTDASTNDTIKGAKKYTKEVLGQDNDASTAVTVYGTRKYVSEVLGQDGDVSTKVTVHGAIQKAKDVKTELLGTSDDASTDTTIYGVQKKAEAVKTELLGDAATDTSTSKTIEGLIKKIEDTSTNTTMHLYSGESGTTSATHVTADGQTYRLVQGSDVTNVIATFNIEKDSFVQDASVVNFATDAAAQAATGVSTATAGHYIHMIIRATDETTTEKNIWIPAESLVDSYDASNGNNNVIVTVDNTTNKIWATTPVSDGTHLVQHNNTEVTLATIAGQTVKAKIASLENTADDTAGGVKITETVTNGNAELSARIVDGAVTTAKIVDGNVTEAKLSSDVSTKLNGAVQTVTGETAISDPNNDYINVKVSAAKTGTDVSLSTTYSLTIHDVSTATSSSNGLADASTVKTYVQTYVGEQLTWAVWPSQA